MCELDHKRRILLTLLLPSLSTEPSYIIISDICVALGAVCRLQQESASDCADTYCMHVAAIVPVIATVRVLDGSSEPARHAVTVIE